jgi:hypothetical protein
MNSLVFIVFDSARFDAVAAARTRWLKRLGKLERRFSYASWTSPSHFSYLMGQLPHESPKKVFASRAYEQELLKWNRRLGIKGVSFGQFLPELSLPKVLKHHGYRTHAMVSMPVLNPSTPMALFFDTYELMPQHNRFDLMIEKLDFSGGTPRFYFLNVGETHYPYALPGQVDEKLPRIHGVHGVFKHLGDPAKKAADRSRWFTARELKSLRHRQIECVEYLDALLERAFEKCPRGTHFIVTSDHGELFGEDGFFGHGPIMHEKVFEIPFVEGRRPA